MLGSVVIAFMCCDIALWLFRPVKHPYYDPILNRHLNLYPKMVVEFKSDGKVMPGVTGSTQFTINAFGFRSPRLQSIDKPSDMRRIFCIGGSTTECNYIDDQDVWTEQLNQRLQERMPSDVIIDVINAGRAGHSTREHITMLAQRVIPFDPDLVIVMAGINDMIVQMAPDYSPCREDRRSRYTLFAGEVLKIKYLICSVSQIMRRVALIRRGSGRRDVLGNFVQDLEGKWHKRWRARLTQMPIERLTDPNCFPRPEFEQNLQSLIGICRTNEIPILLLTQPAIYRSDLDEYEKSLLWFTPGGRHYSSGDMALLLNRYNECTRKVADKLDAPLVDLAVQLPRDTTVFYDDCHFNVSGCAAVAKIIAEAPLKMLSK
jgi:lysophospholipase L1-like esterase